MVADGNAASFGLTVGDLVDKAGHLGRLFGGVLLRFLVHRPLYAFNFKFNYFISSF